MDVCTADLQTIVNLLRTVLTILQIGIPILLLLFGTIDLGKAVMAGDEKEIKGAINILIKRAIAAVAVFVLFLLVSVVTGLVGAEDWRNCWEASKGSHKVDSGV